MAPGQRVGLMAARRVAIAFGCVLLALTGCSDDSVDDSNPWAAELRQAQQDATSDFEREVLADGVISRAEYDEAANRYNTCLKDQGIQAGLEDQFGFWVTVVSRNVSVSDTALDAAIDRCRSGTIEFIEPMFYDLTRNPDRVDERELFVECAKRTGLAPASFTLEDWNAASRIDSQVDFSKLPFTDEDERFHQCMMNPSG